MQAWPRVELQRAKILSDLSQSCATGSAPRVAIDPQKCFHRELLPVSALSFLPNLGASRSHLRRLPLHTLEDLYLEGPLGSHGVTGTHCECTVLDGKFG